MNKKIIIGFVFLIILVSSVYAFPFPTGVGGRLNGDGKGFADIQINAYKEGTNEVIFTKNIQTNNEGIFASVVSTDMGDTFDLQIIAITIDGRKAELILHSIKAGNEQVVSINLPELKETPTKPSSGGGGGGTTRLPSNENENEFVSNETTENLPNIDDELTKLIEKQKRIEDFLKEEELKNSISNKTTEQSINSTTQSPKSNFNLFNSKYATLYIYGLLIVVVITNLTLVAISIFQKKKKEKKIKFKTLKKQK